MSVFLLTPAIRRDDQHIGTFASATRGVQHGAITAIAFDSPESSRLTAPLAAPLGLAAARVPRAQTTAAATTGVLPVTSLGP